MKRAVGTTAPTYSATIQNFAIREIFSENNFQKANHCDGIATLRIDNASFYSDNPIYFAESYPSSTTPLATNTSSCHDVEVSPSQWAQSTTAYDFYNIIHARLFSLFADVLCIFADDFQNFEDVVMLLEAWAAAGSGSIMPKKIRPKVVIVKRGVEVTPSPTYDLLELEEMQFTLRRKAIRGFFHSVIVLHLAAEQISPLARFRRLKELLWRQMDEVRQFRPNENCLYSATHLAQFFRMAVAHTASSLSEPFDFILASRCSNEIRSDHTDHLSSFLSLGAGRNTSCDSMTDYIASTILLDAYPPGMHCKAFVQGKTAIGIHQAKYSNSL